MRALALLASLLVGACESTTGTVQLELATAPGSTVMDSVETLRLTLTDPPESREAQRDSDGSFDLALSFPAEGQITEISVEGLDASGALVATGASPAFSIGPTNARVVIYVAAPLSIAPAPVALGPAREAVASVALPYGALFAGGRDAAGAASDAVSIYNVYDHSLVGGLAMPIKRSEVTLAASSSGLVYVLGGRDEAGTEVARLLAFNTAVAPSGLWVDLGDQPAFARASELAVPIGPDRFLITGLPPGELAGGELSARTDIVQLPRAGASVTGTDGARAALFVTETQLIHFRDDRFATLAGGGTAVAGIPATGKLIVVSSGVDALLVDAATGTIEPHPGVFTIPRGFAALAATDRYIVAAGNGTADILDVRTLERLATVPVAQRGGARAYALPNGQVLIAGGSPANDLIELFTPPPRS